MQSRDEFERRRRAALRAWVLAAVAVAMAGGCRQVAGIEEPVPGTPQTSLTCGALTDAKAGCETCLVDGCCDEATTCAGVAACAPLASCAARCTPNDPACLDACEASAPASSVASDALMTCLRHACDGKCATCGDVPLALRNGFGPLVPRDEPSCRACAAQSCCDVGSACAADADCLALLSCHASCLPDTNCHAGCDAAHASGRTSYALVENCLQGHCDATCPSPAADWGCIGNFQWPAAQKASVAEGGQAVDLPNLNQGIADVRARAFANTDAALTSPLGQAKGDARGNVHVSGLPVGATILSAQNAGFDGFLELSAPDRMTTYFFTNKPIYDDTIDFKLPVISVATVQVLASLSGNEVDTSRALVMAYMADCHVQAAAGVSFSIQPAKGDTSGVIAFYSNGYNPSEALKETDPLGFGGFLNVPPGPVIITAHDHATGKKLVSTLVYAWADKATFVILYPSATQPLETTSRS